MTDLGDTEAKASRRWERFKVTVRVNIALTRDGAKFDFTGTAHDISIGGMALFVANDLQIGETILVVFSLPYSKNLSVYGVVRNRNNFEYGVEFRSLSAQVKADLERNCRALSLLDAGSVSEY